MWQMCGQVKLLWLSSLPCVLNIMLWFGQHAVPLITMLGLNHCRALTSALCPYHHAVPQTTMLCLPRLESALIMVLCLGRHEELTWPQCLAGFKPQYCGFHHATPASLRLHHGAVPGVPWGADMAINHGLSTVNSSPPWVCHACMFVPSSWLPHAVP